MLRAQNVALGFLLCSFFISAYANEWHDYAVARAQAQIGDEYIIGMEGPDLFDCSGLTQYAYRHVGIQLHRAVSCETQKPGTCTVAQVDQGQPVVTRKGSYYDDATDTMIPYEDATGKITEVGINKILSQLQRGDLVFFGNCSFKTPKCPAAAYDEIEGHVGIYVGGTTFINAYWGETVKEEDFTAPRYNSDNDPWYWKSLFIAARRLSPSAPSTTFAVNDIVEVTSDGDCILDAARDWACPSSPKTVAGVQGNVLDLPMFFNELWYWHVELESGADGWVAEEFLMPGPTSTAFSSGDTVEVTADVTPSLDVFSTPNGDPVGTQLPSSLGTVIGGPVWEAGYWWWEVVFADFMVGWVVEDYLIASAAVQPCDVGNPVVPCVLNGTTYDTFAGNYSQNRVFYRASSYDVTISDGYLQLSLKDGLPHTEGYAYLPGRLPVVWTSPPPYNVDFGVFGPNGQFNGAGILQDDNFEWIGVGAATGGAVVLEDFESYPLGTFATGATNGAVSWEVYFDDIVDWSGEIISFSDITTNSFLGSNALLGIITQNVATILSPTTPDKTYFSYWIKVDTSNLAESEWDNLTWDNIIISNDSYGDIYYTQICHSVGDDFGVAFGQIRGSTTNGCLDQYITGNFVLGEWVQIEVEVDFVNHTARGKVNNSVWSAPYQLDSSLNHISSITLHPVTLHAGIVYDQIELDAP